MLGGSTDLTELAAGVFSGDLSGIAVKTMPAWARLCYFPPTKLALLKNWEEKIDLLARQSLKQDIRMIGGVPSWLLIFTSKLAEIVPNFKARLVNAFPNLELLVHGGVNFNPYYNQFREILSGSHAELREVYPASEGFVALADRRYGEGLRLILDHGIFFEFVPLEELNLAQPTRHWIQNVEPGVNYAVILSTCAGLWSYILNDTVKFVDLKPPRLLITGRTSYYLSAFGEHLIAEEIEDAISSAAQALSAAVVDYSVGPIYPEKPGDLGGHLYIVEFSSGMPQNGSLERFKEVLDQRLCKRNEDYEAHRAGGFGLKAPTILGVRPGTFAAWMKRRGKLGGQHKVPRIITDQKLFRDLIEFVQQY
jgi:hypothetical protein